MNQNIILSVNEQIVYICKSVKKKLCQEKLKYIQNEILKYFL